jgi:hypothetical protein
MPLNLTRILRGRTGCHFKGGMKNGSNLPKEAS